MRKLIPLRRVLRDVEDQELDLDHVLIDPDQVRIIIDENVDDPDTSDE